MPRWLAEKFRRYVAEKYGFRRGALSRAIIDLVQKELGLSKSGRAETVASIVGIGLRSDYMWNGEDLVEALRKRMRVCI
ncbi:MAG: hypothetical protein J7L98_01020 [Candidatus Verstraetearchaeota archaeon]|nr:hypothetical protein [Candidatus Verstraetearchaeota archaeon]